MGHSNSNHSRIRALGHAGWGRPASALQASAGAGSPQLSAGTATGLRGLGGSILVSPRGLCLLRVRGLGVSGESPKEPTEAALLTTTQLWKPHSVLSAVFRSLRQSASCPRAKEEAQTSHVGGD